jgi:hypothetical protein
MKPLMYRRLLAVVLVVALAVAGVRIVDPSFGGDEEVRADSRPAVVAADAVRNAQSRAVTVDILSAVESDASGETTVRRGRIRVEHDRGVYHAVYSKDESGDGQLGFFGTDGMGWTRSADADWGRSPSARYLGFGTVLDPVAVERADVRVLDDNETTLAIRLTGSDAGGAAEGLHVTEVPSGRLDVYVDKQRWLPTRAVRTYQVPNRNKTVRVSYRFTRYGETSVERPNGVPGISLWELLGDIYYG